VSLEGLQAQDISPSQLASAWGLAASYFFSSSLRIPVGDVIVRFDWNDGNSAATVVFTLDGLSYDSANDAWSWLDDASQDGSLAQGLEDLLLEAGATGGFTVQFESLSGVQMSALAGAARLSALTTWGVTAVGMLIGLTVAF